MADLGNLWFSLGLDDSKFDKEWKAAFQKYKNDAKIDVLINVSKDQIKNINDITTALSNVSGIAGKKKAKIDIEVTQRTLDGIKALKDMGITSTQLKEIRNAAKATEEYAKHLQRAKNISNTGQKKIVANFKEQTLWLQNLKTMVADYLSIYAIKNFVVELANVTGEFEKQRVTLQAMVGEMEGLDIYNKMKTLSVESPFEFKDLASYAKQLAAFSVPYEELYDTTKRLADVSAGLGVDMSRIILAYGQIKSAGVLKGTELRQLTESGLPILDKLAEKFTELEGRTVSIGDVFGKISQKLVSFDMVKDVFNELTSAGGKFYNMQEIQSETLAGKIANLKDAYAIMLTEIGERSDGFLKGSVEGLYSLMNNWEKLGRIITSVLATYGAFQISRVFTAAIPHVHKFAQTFRLLYNNATQARSAISSIFIALKGAAGWAAIIGLVAGLATAIYQAAMASNRFNKEMDELLNKQTINLEREVREFERLKKAIDEANKGSQERREAISEFNNLYGGYLGYMLKETSTAQELALAYTNVANAIKEKNKQEAKSRAEQEIESEYGTKLQETMTKVKKELEEKAGLSSDEARDIVNLLRDYYAKGGYKAAEIAKIIKERIGEDVYKKTNLGVSGHFEDLKTTLRKQVQEYEKKMQEAADKIDLRFSSAKYSTKAEAELVGRINELYKSRIENLRKQDISKEEYNKKLREYEELKLQEMAEAYGQLGLPEIADSYIKQWEKLTKSVEGWRKEITQLATDKGVATFFAPQENEDWFAYVERAQKEYKEVVTKLKNIGTDPQGMEGALKAQKSFLEAMAASYKIQLDEKGDKAAETKRLKEQREAVAKLKTQYDSLLAVYKAYINLKKKTGDEGIATRAVAEEFADFKNGLLAALEKDGDPEKYLEQMFASLGELALVNGGEFGERFVEGMKSTLGTLNVKDVVDAIGIGKSLFDELKKWGMEDFALQGEGATLDISKALKEQDEADRRALARAQELQDKINQIYNAGEAEKAAAREVLINEIANQEQLSEEQIAELKKKSLDDIFSYAIDRANELAQTEGENNKKVAQDKINELGKAYAKQVVEESKTLGAGAFENLANKSYGNLKVLQQELNTLMSQDPKISDETKKKLEEQGITLDEFIKNYKEYLQLLGKKVKDTKGEKLKDDLLAAGDAALEVVESLKQLSDTDFMSGFLDAMGLGLNVAKQITQAFSKKEDGSGFELTNVTSLIGAISAVATSIINGVAAAKQYREEMQRAANAFKTGIIESANEALILGEKFETIFGENIISALNADNEAIRNTSRELKNASRSIANMKIKTKKGFWGMGVQYTSLSDLAPQLFKPDGTVNGKYLDEFLDAYGDKLSESQKALLEHLKTTYEQYEDAMGEVNDYLSDIFSDTASTIADRMIEAFAATGNAATELGDIVNGIAKQMAKDLIQSLLIEQYLTPAMERVKSLYNAESKSYEADPTIRIQKSILAMREGLEQAETGAAEVSKILQGLADYGIDFSENAENGSDVLSGLTEAQQNLLMGYINGIRADVSYNKGMMSSIVNSVGTISNNVADAIIVWKQIEANTHRSADGVDRIIGFFESVMGPYDGGGGQAFKVNIA